MTENDDGNELNISDEDRKLVAELSEKEFAIFSTVSHTLAPLFSKLSGQEITGGQVSPVVSIPIYKRVAARLDEERRRKGL